MEIQEYLQGIRTLRYDWSDEIPNEILNGGMSRPPPKYKVRVNWFQGVLSWLGYGLEMDLLDSKKYLQIKNNFVFHIQSTKLGLRLTTEGDIKIGNKILDIIVRDLEGRL